MKKTISTILILSALAAPLSGSACFADTPKTNTGITTFIETAISGLKALRSKLYSSSNDTCKTLFEKTYTEESIIDEQLKFADQHNFDLCKVLESLSKFSHENYEKAVRDIDSFWLKDLLEYAKNHKLKLHDIIKDCADKAKGNDTHELLFLYNLNQIANVLNEDPQHGELRKLYKRYLNQQKKLDNFLLCLPTSAASRYLDCK